MGDEIINLFLYIKAFVHHGSYCKISSGQIKKKNRRSEQPIIKVDFIDIYQTFTQKLENTFWNTYGMYMKNWYWFSVNKNYSEVEM